MKKAKKKICHECAHAKKAKAARRRSNKLPREDSYRSRAGKANKSLVDLVFGD